MKTLKDYKAAIKIGVKLECTDHPNENMLGVRTVTHVQGNAYTFSLPHKDNLKFWSYYPKASDIEFDGSNTIRIRLSALRYQTLTLLQAAP